MLTNKTIVSLGLLIIGAAASVAAQPMRTSNFEVGEEIQLQGCVVDAERSGNYVFSRVTAWPVATTPEGRYGPRHFWLADAAKFLPEHVGRTIQVTGKIVDLRESEIERNPQYNSQGGTRVGIELPTGSVFTAPGLAGIPAGQRDSKVDMKITLVKVEMISLLVVMQSCLDRADQSGP
ncbi:MAG: hypothetical protein Q8L75_08450 [Acidobacteriota bacterium]|nr:hypothetical protein [Acidobacteriota bacterium]